MGTAKTLVFPARLMTAKRSVMKTVMQSKRTRTRKPKTYMKMTWDPRTERRGGRTTSWALKGSHHCSLLPLCSVVQFNFILALYACKDLLSLVRAWPFKTRLSCTFPTFHHSL